MSSSDQLFFPSMSGPEPATPTDRLFLAIFPDADVAQEIAELAQQLRARHGLRGKALDPSRFHVTLHHLGDFSGGLPEGVVQSVSEVSAATAAALPPFDIEFSQAGSFIGKRRNLPFVLKMKSWPSNSALEKLQQKLGNALALRRLGFDPSMRFTPHTTLLYDDKQIADHPVPPVTWRVHEIVLIHSLLGKTVHIPLGRWPLASPIS